jgi:hypothetical protein
MKLDSQNRLILYKVSDGTAAITIDPNSGGGIAVSGDIKVNGKSVVTQSPNGQIIFPSESNFFVGNYSGNTSATGVNNVGLGYNTLHFLERGNSNLAVGAWSLVGIVNGSGNVGIGVGALNQTDGTDNVGIGANSLYRLTTGWYNVGIGSFTGDHITTGISNVLIGSHTGGDLTTGSNNILVGFDIEAPTPTTSNLVSIGNLIFGTGVNATGSTISTGKVGIGTNDPAAKLHVQGDAYFSGPVHIEPQGDLDMGGFDHDPNNP